MELAEERKFSKIFKRVSIGRYFLLLNINTVHNEKERIWATCINFNNQNTFLKIFFIYQTSPYNFTLLPCGLQHCWSFFNVGCNVLNISVCT